MGLQVSKKSYPSLSNLDRFNAKVTDTANFNSYNLTVDNEQFYAMSNSLKDGLSEASEKLNQIVNEDDLRSEMVNDVDIPFLDNDTKSLILKGGAEVVNSVAELGSEGLSIDSLDDLGAFTSHVVATSSVFGLSALNGVLDAAEGIVDGAITLRAKTMATSARVVGSVFGFFGANDIADMFNTNASIAESKAEEIVKPQFFDNLFQSFWESDIGQGINDNSKIKSDSTFAGFTKEAVKAASIIAVDFIPCVGPILSVSSTIGMATEEELNNGKGFEDASNTGLMWGAVDTVFSLIPSAGKAIKENKGAIKEFGESIFKGADGLFETAKKAGKTEKYEAGMLQNFLDSNIKSTERVVSREVKTSIQSKIHDAEKLLDDADVLIGYKDYAFNVEHEYCQAFSNIERMQKQNKLYDTYQQLFKNTGLADKLEYMNEYGLKHNAGENYLQTVMKKYIETGDLSLFTRENGVRELLSEYSEDELKSLFRVKLKYDSVINGSAKNVNISNVPSSMGDDLAKNFNLHRGVGINDDFINSFEKVMSDDKFIDANVKTLLKNIGSLKEINPKICFRNDPTKGAYFSGGLNCIALNETNVKNTGVLFHELGHAFWHTVTGDAKNYWEIAETPEMKRLIKNAQKRINANPEKLKDIISFSQRESHRAHENVEVWWSTVEQEEKLRVSNLIDSFYRRYNDETLNQSIAPVLNIINLGKQNEEFVEIFEKAGIKFDDDIFKIINNEVEMKNMALFQNQISKKGQKLDSLLEDSGLQELNSSLNSIMQKADPINARHHNFQFIYQHEDTYWSEAGTPYRSSLDELMADYFRITSHGQTEVLDTLRDVAGDEIVDYLASECGRMVSILIEKGIIKV